MDEHYLYEYPGINKILHGSMTLSTGIKPSVATIEMAPQDNYIPTIAPLKITSNGATVIRFDDCRPVDALLRRSRDGWIWTITIHDRRWRWEFGQISGHYNQRTRQGGFIKPTTKKTPQELAELCLAAMGETNYIITQLPNTNYPEVHWDVVNPAVALQDLCEKCGARIVLLPDSNGGPTVRIYPIGTGSDLPTGLEMNAIYTFNPPEKPDFIQFVGDYIKFQCKFTMEAVGRDTDGKVKLIDDLSYAPSGGWGADKTIPKFTEIAEEDARKLAQATVYRWYRTKKMLSGASPTGSGTTVVETLDIPGFVTLDNMNGDGI